MRSILRHREGHRTGRIGCLRAAVLGANDGIVSTASLVVTMQAMKQAVHYYGASLQGLASSVVASEHSIMTAGGPQEVAIARHIIETHLTRQSRSWPTR